MPLGWGVVGENRFDPEQRAIVRENVGRGVRYVRPPLPPEHPVWDQPDADPDQETPDSYRMVLTAVRDGGADADLAALGYTSLLQFGEALHNGRPDERTLDQLDRIAIRLLRLTEYLHARGCWLGLVSPENILLYPQDEPAQVLLADLGFLRPPGVPGGRALSWLDPTSAYCRRWQNLWLQPGAAPLDLEGLARINRSAGFGSKPLLDASVDLRTLVRLFTWVLTGTVYAEPPAHEHTDNELWGTFDKVFNGHIKSAAELRRALGGDGAYQGPTTPLTRHFRPPPRPPIPVSWRQVARVVPVLVCAGLALGGAYWAYHYLKPIPLTAAVSKEDPRKAPTSELPPHSQLRELLAQFHGATSLPEKRRLLAQMYNVRLSSNAAERELEAWHREHARALLVAAQFKRFGEITREFDDLTPQQNDLTPDVAEMETVLVEMKSHPVHPELAAEEEQCLQQYQGWLAPRR